MLPSLEFNPPPRHFSLSSSRRVGKTSLMRQYVSKLYSSQYKVPHPFALLHLDESLFPLFFFFGPTPLLGGFFIVAACGANSVWRVWGRPR